MILVQFSETAKSDKLDLVQNPAVRHCTLIWRILVKKVKKTGQVSGSLITHTVNLKCDDLIAIL